MSSTDLDEMATMIREGAEGIGHDFTEPDDDWDPTAFLATDKGVIVAALMLDKEYWTTVLSDLAKEHHATAIATLYSTWMVALDKDEQERRAASVDDYPMPSEHPDRKEALWLVATDGETKKGWHVFIERHEDKPPTLGEWHEDDGISITGRQIDPLVEVLRG